MSAENETEQTLAKLKVPELKARCKAVSPRVTEADGSEPNDELQLKIPNFSKLSKTDLIAKILAVRTDATATASTKLPNNDVDQHETAGQRPRPPSDTFTEAAKEPAVKERKKEPTKRKTVPKASNNSPDDADEGETIQKKPKGANALQQPDKAPECSGAAAGTAKTVPTVSVTRPILPASTSVTKQPMHNAPALSKTIPPVSPAVKSTSVKGVPKSLAKATPAVKAKFRPLAEVAPKEAPVAPPPPVVQLETVSLATPTDRMSHVEKHFLNGMFRQMHRYRAKPILKPPFPTHPSFPKSSPTGHLAFQGLHPDLYVKVQSDAFEVALRFWVARLHSSMQLGSSEAWSLQAGGIGLLGPDMSTWPPITGCVQIVSDIWAVTTKEDKVDINYLVIGEIGEVIGHSRNTSAKDEGLVGGCRLREDWKRYIGNGKRKSLISAVKSKDSYEFSGGISRVWRGGQTSHIKVKIAERAVLASCALNR